MDDADVGSSGDGGEVSDRMLMLVAMVTVVRTVI